MKWKVVFLVFLVFGFFCNSIYAQSPEFNTTKKAAEQGDDIAQFQLGFMYSIGKDVPQDDLQAVFWYQKSAEN